MKLRKRELKQNESGYFMVITEGLKSPLSLDLKSHRSEPLTTFAHHLHLAPGGISKLNPSYQSNLDRNYHHCHYYSEKHVESNRQSRIVIFLL